MKCGRKEACPPPKDRSPCKNVVSLVGTKWYFIIFYKKTFVFFVLCIRMTASDNTLDFVRIWQESSVGFLPILNLQIRYFTWAAVCRTEFGPFQPF